MLANVLVWLFLAIVWGSTWMVVKIGLSDLSPFLFAGVRFSLAAVVLLGILIARGRWRPRHRGEWTLIAVTAFLTISFQYGLQFWAQQHVASGLASVLTATIPVFVMLFAHWYLPDEPLRRGKVAGVVLGVIGVTTIFSDQLTAAGTLAFWGSAALVVGAAASARAQVTLKAHAVTLDPLIVAGWQMVFGAMPLVAFGWWLEGSPFDMPWTPRAVGALVYLAVFGSAAAFFAMYWLFRRMDVTKVLSVSFANPVVAVALGWLILDEHLSWRALTGGVAVLAGLALVMRPAARAERRTSGRSGVTLNVSEAATAGDL